jgi:acyl-[acyl-carrier-protein]-phospholipid O-acyltransferase/long-chain-fatty-acid--[acyl-carrier-protein] ligase
MKKQFSFLTSGSSGEPKGVVLSHHNVIGNVTQFTVMLDASPEDSLLASLPFFHSFGCTVTLWYPLIEGTPIRHLPESPRSRKEC